jgi:hypothetical protein
MVHGVKSVMASILRVAVSGLILGLVAACGEKAPDNFEDQSLDPPLSAYVAVLESLEISDRTSVFIRSQMMNSDGRLPGEVRRELQRLGYSVEGGYPDSARDFTREVRFSALRVVGEGEYEVETHFTRRTPQDLIIAYHDRVRHRVRCGTEKCEVDSFEWIHSIDIPPGTFSGTDQEDPP